jgi:hypothetical protein
MPRQTSVARTAPPKSIEVPRAERVLPTFALPDIPQLRHVPRRIDADDEAELRWFARGPSVANIARSSGAFGNQLDVASAFGFGSIPCVRCGGRIRKRKRGGKDVVVDWRDGTGLAPKDHFGKRVSYATALADYRKRMQKELGIVLSSKPVPKPELGFDPAQLWRASVDAFAAQGKRLMTDADFRAVFEKLPENLCQPCRICQGIGVVPRRAAAHAEVTAYPTGSSKHGGTEERADLWALSERMSKGGVIRDGAGRIGTRELERYQEVAAIMADVAGMSEMALLSLEEYYADDNGQRALEVLVEDRFGLKGAARMRAASELRDHQCQVFNLAAYGAA